MLRNSYRVWRENEVLAYDCGDEVAQLLVENVTDGENVRLMAIAEPKAEQAVRLGQ